jgi:hypothetical protein
LTGRRALQTAPQDHDYFPWSEDISHGQFLSITSLVRTISRQALTTEATTPRRRPCPQCRKAYTETAQEGPWYFKATLGREAVDGRRVRRPAVASPRWLRWPNLSRAARSARPPATADPSTSRRCSASLPNASSRSTGQSVAGRPNDSGGSGQTPSLVDGEPDARARRPVPTGAQGPET